MQRVGRNRLRKDLSLSNNVYTCSKGFAFPTVSIGGADVATSLATNAAAITTNNNRLDTLIDSGSTLDTISELKAAWESGDGTLNTAIGSLTTAAAADRQNIRNEFAATDTAINATLATARTDILELKPVRIYYVDAGRSDFYTETGSFKSPFKSLVTAMTGDLLEDSSTDHVIFKLAPGDYTGAISITKAAPNQTGKSTEAVVRSPISKPPLLGTRQLEMYFICGSLRLSVLRIVPFASEHMAAISVTCQPLRLKTAAFTTWVRLDRTTNLLYLKQTRPPTGPHVGQPVHIGRTEAQ